MNDKDKIRNIGKMKMKLELMEICEGLPVEFIWFINSIKFRYLDYVRKLSFKSLPDYKHL